MTVSELRAEGVQVRRLRGELLGSHGGEVWFRIETEKGDELLVISLIEGDDL